MGPSVGPRIVDRDRGRWRSRRSLRGRRVDHHSRGGWPVRPGCARSPGRTAPRCRARSARVRRRQPQPSRGQDAEEVAMAEEDDPAAGRFEPSDDAVGPGTDRLHRFTPGQPSRNRYHPGRSVRIWPWSGPRSRRSPTRAGRRRVGPGQPNPASSHVRRARPSGLTKTEFERLALEPFAQAPGIGLPACGQRDIGPARVLVRDRPRRLSVPRQVDFAGVNRS